MGSGEGARGNVREAEGGGDPAGVTPIVGVEDGSFEDASGSNGEIGSDDDGAGPVIVGDCVCLQDDLVSCDTSAVLDEAFRVDFYDRGFKVSAGCHPGIGSGLRVSGSLETGACDDFGASRDEGDLASGSSDGAVEGALVGEEGGVSGGGVEVAVDDHLSGAAIALIGVGTGGGEGAEGEGGGGDAAAGFESHPPGVDEGEGAIGGDGAVDG